MDNSFDKSVNKSIIDNMTKPSLSPIVKKALVEHRNILVRALYNDGFRVSEISWIFRITPQLVSSIIKNNKVKK